MSVRGADLQGKLALSAFLLIAASALVLLTASAAGVLEVKWATVDGGGATSSQGGSYSLAGTIGQPDAGPAMNGEAYSLTGGFLAGASAGGPPPAFVTISGNAGPEGVTLSFTDGSPQTTTSDAEGDYELTVSYNWTGTVTPTKPDYLFTPDHRDYADVTADQLDENYGAEKQTPTIISVFPKPLSTSCLKPQVGVKVLLAALVRTPAGGLDPSTISLELDNVVRTSEAQISQSMSFPASHATVLYTPPGNLSAALHHGAFTYPSPGGTITYEWNFNVTNVICPQGAQDGGPDANVELPAFEAPIETTLPP
jgi:hypothetical protein